MIKLLNVQVGGMAALAMLDLQDDGDGLGSTERGGDGDEEVVEAKLLDNACTCETANGHGG